MSIEPFNRLVKLTARAFYDDITKMESQPKTGRSDNRGIAVVVLDALTRRQWVREEDLAKELKLHLKQLRRILRFFEEEKLVTREHRKETAKGAKIYSAAVAATGDGQQTGKEGEEKIKLHTHSYCCLDYAQIYDVVRYRLHRMKKTLKDKLEDKNTVQEYICPNCGKRYNALDALRLVSMEDEYFHCERCNGVLVPENDKLVAQEVGDGDDNARRRQRENVKDQLERMEAQLKPLNDQLNRVKELAVPEFGSLQEWEARATAAARAANSSANDPSKSSQGLGYGGTPMPFLGETKVEVTFSGVEGKEGGVKSESASMDVKLMPPWMIKEGMNLTTEQRGELKQEAKMDGSSGQVDSSDDKKSTVQNGEGQNIQEEYFKAYYAALLKQRQEAVEAAKRQESLNMPDFDDLPSNRQVGMKSKREDDEADNDFEWEQPPISGNASESYKVNDLNAEAEPSGDDDDDGVDWESD
ncbi:hypothetical protein SLEP1_g33326 [Rubroshorea leprosula]|uniref:HTH TFE/IIEalpha-type domain-containing protein n=1 Tax=Rubroshorea leprosula TaxID=152421 RepID=A0AAV5KGB2_9ROSI|nr:hypothetical protein SLEP1_g33326 [Rubroshorea leprosula]